MRWVIAEVDPIAFGQAVAAAVIAAVGGIHFLFRKGPKAVNGNGKKEPVYEIIIHKLDILKEKLESLDRRVDDHIEQHRGNF
jgi:hypothetical protein